MTCAQPWRRRSSSVAGSRRRMLAATRRPTARSSVRASKRRGASSPSASSAWFGRSKRMGKSEIRVIHVPRWLTVLAWLAVSAAMAVSVYLLSGRAYSREVALSSIVTALRRSPSTTSILAAAAPATADFLFFVPWGALAFLSLDSGSRRMTYSVTLLLGVAFALALMSWQTVLPARITRGVDAMWNIVGCAAGAVSAHARKGVRVRFE